MKAALLRVKHSIALLTERHAILFAVLDALFLFAGIVIGLNGGENAAALYIPFFLIPCFLVAIPMLADTVAIERRSGTLDLALTSPGARFYFERRALAVVALIVVQGWITIVITRAIMEPFPLSGPFLQIVSVALFIGAVSLNWAVRLKTAGAVMFATYVTCLAFAPWLFSNPIHSPTANNQGPMTIADIVHWSQNNLVLLASAAVAYAYARQRLMRPELIIA
jgi:hypothetical protein